MSLRSQAAAGSHTPFEAESSLRTALGDPTLELAFWYAARDGYVTAAGDAVDLDQPDDARYVTRIADGAGAPLVAVVHDPALLDEPLLFNGALAAASLAIERDRLQAELRAQLEELRASRARIVAAGDAERRQLERNLHDGAQQRLVTLSLHLHLARERLHSAPEEADRMLEDAAGELRVALQELRELARGLHPSMLSERGLAAALEGLALRVPVPVDLELELDSRLPEQVEVALFYVIAEALANVVKHAGAASAAVRVAPDGTDVTAAITDDGVGGADAAAGSGLSGLADRVEALGGRLHVESPPGRGTAVTARMPVPVATPA